MAMTAEQQRMRSERTYVRLTSEIALLATLYDECKSEGLFPPAENGRAAYRIEDKLRTKLETLKQVKRNLYP